jgi:RNA polymerase sigma factor (TIGR02999 family)
MADGTSVRVASGSCANRGAGKILILRNDPSLASIPDMDPAQHAKAISAVLTRTGGPRVTAEELIPLVYDELRQLAHARVQRFARGQTMRATELVHEAWMRVVHGGDPGWDGRAHFFGAAANAMRNILVEQARRRSAQRRDAARREPIDDDLPAFELEVAAVDVLTLHEALLELEKSHARAARVVELRFFSGLEMAEIARIVAVSVPTVERDWRFARAWLQDRMGTHDAKDG